MNYSNDKIVALMIGRSGSSLPDKNILPVLGKPLLHYTASAARNSKYIGRFYVSSDCPKILAAAQKEGYKPIVRPAVLAQPTSQSVDVVNHALQIIASEGTAEILIVQHANVGTITTQMIDDCIEELLNDSQLSAVVPMHEKSEYHPYRAKELKKDGLVYPFFDFSTMTVSGNRQDLPEALFFDHSIWVLSVRNGVQAPNGQPPWQCMGNHIKPYLTNGCFDVHTFEDLKRTEDWILNHTIHKNQSMLNICENLVRLIQSKLELIMEQRSELTLKPDNSYVSQGDLLVQEIVFSYIQKYLPNHSLISEEMAPFDHDDWDPSGSYVVLDPIDGTENFISGLKEWGVGISIFTDGKHAASCIFLPELNEVLITGQALKKFKSRIQGLSSSLLKEDLINLPNKGVEFRIIGCSMYNMLSAIKGSFVTFENVKGVYCWDVLPGLNLALEHGTEAWVNDKLYNGEILFPNQKYRIKLINKH